MFGEQTFWKIAFSYIIYIRDSPPQDRPPPPPPGCGGFYFPHSLCSYFWIEVGRFRPIVLVCKLWLHWVLLGSQMTGNPVWVPMFLKIDMLEKEEETCQGPRFPMHSFLWRHREAGGTYRHRIHSLLGNNQRDLDMSICFWSYWNVNIRVYSFN